jgi:hypothetical protein
VTLPPPVLDVGAESRRPFAVAAVAQARSSLDGQATARSRGDSRALDTIGPAVWGICGGWWRPTSLISRTSRFGRHVDDRDEGQLRRHQVEFSLRSRAQVQPVEVFRWAVVDHFVSCLVTGVLASPGLRPPGRVRWRGRDEARRKDCLTAQRRPDRRF